LGDTCKKLYIYIDMFKIDIENLEPHIFLYNALAHSIYIFFYLMYNKKINELLCEKLFNKKHILNILFVLGHLFIVFAMIIRINKITRDSFDVVRMGSVGHGTLFLSIALSCLFKLTELNFDTILFLILQLGMIYVYALEYIISNEETIKFYNKILIVLPLFLGIYYYSSHYFHLDTAFSYAYIAVALVYLLLFTITILKLMKKEYITVF
jgi:hypothetical protein